MGMGTSTFDTIINAGGPFSLVPDPSRSGACRPDCKWGRLRPTDGCAKSNGLRPTTERFNGSRGRVDWMEGSSSFMLDSNDDKNNDNEVGMVER